jgi:hypothetical protein
VNHLDNSQWSPTIPSEVVPKLIGGQTGRELEPIMIGGSTWHIMKAASSPQNRIPQAFPDAA